MSKDQRPAIAGAEPGRVPIPVRVLRFPHSDPIDVPGKGPSSSIMSVNQDNKARRMIEYLPWMRHHRITVRVEGKDKIFMVHESRVSHWEPAEDPQR